MIITILVIISFQVYWINENYEREKNSLQLKANIAFQETIHQLQASKLKLPWAIIDSAHNGTSQVLIKEDIFETKKNPIDRISRQVITISNALSSKMRDSLKKNYKFNSTFVIALNNGKPNYNNIPFLKEDRYGDSKDHIMKILYGVDSLQDSLNIKEIMELFASRLKKEYLYLPFKITKTAGITDVADVPLSDVTIGITHPVTYHLSIDNTFPYLLKIITLPILFSLFLITVTILSFVILYRNLLKQQKLAEIKNEFINNITHELRTPIATVGVAIEALKNFNESNDTLKTKEYLDISGNEIQRLSLLVDNVLKVSMFEQKQTELNKEYFDLKVLTQEVLNTMKIQFEKRNATFNFSHFGEKFIIYADKLHITSIIYNLFDNALKYSDQKALIKVEITREENSIDLKVSDNGIGIGPEHIKKIFEKFFRVPTGNNHAVKGYGLGLSYVSEIVKRHNGSIVVESKLNEGSTFTISFNC